MVKRARRRRRTGRRRDFLLEPRRAVRPLLGTRASSFHSLHFETCYHQGIEFCIEHGIARFEPGTQGEHKVSRGFEPTLTWSAHWIVDPRFRAAIGDYLRREGAHIDEYAARSSTTSVSRCAPRARSRS